MLAHICANGDACEELPYVDVVDEHSAGGEAIHPMSLKGVEKAVIHAEPLQQFVLVCLAGLLHDFSSGGEHGKEREANLRLTDEDYVDALNQDAKEPNDNAERCFVDVSEKRREHIACEHLYFFAHRRGELGFVELVDTVFDNIKDIEVHDDHGEHCDALLVVEVAENALDCALHFGVGENCDKRVGGC